MKLPLTILYDGLCPLCSREIAFLRRRSSDALRFVDISEIDPEPFGISHSDAMKALCAIDAAGTQLRGMDAIRGIYRAIGWEWLVAPTAWPVISTLCDLGYALFAKVRPYLGPRCDKNGSCRR